MGQARRTIAFISRHAPKATKVGEERGHTGRQGPLRSAFLVPCFPVFKQTAHSSDGDAGKEILEVDVHQPRSIKMWTSVCLDAFFSHETVNAYGRAIEVICEFRSQNSLNAFQRRNRFGYLPSQAIGLGDFESPKPLRIGHVTGKSEEFSMRNPQSLRHFPIRIQSIQKAHQKRRWKTFLRRPENPNELQPAQSARRRSLIVR